MKGAWRTFWKFKITVMFLNSGSENFISVGWKLIYTKHFKKIFENYLLKIFEVNKANGLRNSLGNIQPPTWAALVVGIFWKFKISALVWNSDFRKIFENFWSEWPQRPSEFTRQYSTSNMSAAWRMFWKFKITAMDRNSGFKIFQKKISNNGS